MPEADIDRMYDYDPKYLADILKSVKTIAMVGASADKTKFSYGVLRQLSEIGYDILPVNPNPTLAEIRGLRVYRSLEDIDNPVDMVDVFRPKEELYGFAEKAIAIGAKRHVPVSVANTLNTRCARRPANGAQILCTRKDFIERLVIRGGDLVILVNR